VNFFLLFSVQGTFPVPCVLVNSFFTSSVSEGAESVPFFLSTLLRLFLKANEAWWSPSQGHGIRTCSP